jgi:rubrerythrin
MLSEKPISMSKVKQKNLNEQILRLGMIAELDAVSLYQQMAEMTDDPQIREILLDIAREEKTHVGEFEALLLKHDQEQVEELKKGAKEVEEKR